MDWEVILDAATGQATALEQVVKVPLISLVDLTTLLLLDEAPHAAAALVVAASAPSRDALRGLAAQAPLVHAALEPHVAPALAAWRADPQWVDRVVGAGARERLRRGVAVRSGALRAHPAALRDAVTIVVRGFDAIGCLLAALGAAGWRALTDDLRRALLARAAPDDLGWVWNALDDAQRTAAQRAAATQGAAARLIGRIGAAAWHATDEALRKRLIDAVVHDPENLPMTAPAWPGMTDDERTTLTTAAGAYGSAWNALRLLVDLDRDGRATLTAAQREALETLAMRPPDAWLVLALRAADAGWTALTADERGAVLAELEWRSRGPTYLLRTVGAAGWNAMRADEQARLAAAVRGSPKTLFCCPPALWSAIAGDALPPATAVATDSRIDRPAEDADADLGGLPAAHQTLVLALAPWRPEDAAKDSVRMQRLRAAWNQTPADERVALATGRPLVLPTVAAAARLGGGSGAVLDAVGATVARVVTMTGESDVKRDIGAMLRGTGAWRAWMAVFAPSDGDPSDAWAAWRDAARRGSVPDPALCARLAATPRESRARGARPRA